MIPPRRKNVKKKTLPKVNINEAQTHKKENRLKKRDTKNKKKKTIDTKNLKNRKEKRRKPRTHRSW